MRSIQRTAPRTILVPLGHRARLLRAAASVLAMLVLAAIGCSGQPIGRTVQAGGTFILPLAADNPYADHMYEPAYGGTEITDTQHGKLTVWLFSETATWHPLPTRITVASRMPVEAPSRGGEAFWGRQLILIADVPASLAPGDYLVALRHHPPEGGFQMAGLQEFYSGLTVLPASIPISGGPPAVGQPLSTDVQHPTGATILEDWGGGVGLSVPDPSFRVALKGVASGGNPVPVAAYNAIDIDYPDSQIVIGGVVARDPTWMTVWSEDNGPGSIRVHTVMPGGGNISAAFSVVYGYKSGTTKIDLANITPTVVDVHDVTGAELSPDDFNVSKGW